MNEIESAIQEAVKVAIREYDKEKKLQGKRNAFHNTKLLMKHYNDLKEHVRRGISDVKELESSREDLIEHKNEIDDLYMNTDELFIESIKKSKSKSIIMIAHIDAALSCLKNKHKNKGTIEKYLALENYFIKEKTYEEISEILNCGVNTPRRWINELTNELGVYLFGIDSIKLE